MSRFSLFCGLLSLAFGKQKNVNHVPNVAAALMVRNEEKTLEQSLLSLCRHGVSHFFLYDTGSTDQTLKFARSFSCPDRLTKVNILEGEFVDFATSS